MKIEVLYFVGLLLVWGCACEASKTSDQEEVDKQEMIDMVLDNGPKSKLPSDSLTSDDSTKTKGEEKRTSSISPEALKKDSLLKEKGKNALREEERSCDELLLEYQQAVETAISSNDFSKVSQVWNPRENPLISYCMKIDSLFSNRADSINQIFITALEKL